MRSFLTVLFTSLSFSVGATEHNTPADLTINCNANGAVVRVNEGPFKGNTYYLGKSCDAARKGGGTGRWWYAAAAFIVDINGQGVRFANDMDCPALPYCLPK